MNGSTFFLNHTIGTCLWHQQPHIGLGNAQLLVDTLRSHAWDLLVASPASHWACKRAFVGRHLAITRLGLVRGSTSLTFGLQTHTCWSTHCNHTLETCLWHHQPHIGPANARLLVDALRSHAWDLLVAAPALHLACKRTLVGRHFAITRLGLACGITSLTLGLQTHTCWSTLCDHTLGTCLWHHQSTIGSHTRTHLLVDSLAIALGTCL